MSKPTHELLTLIVCASLKEAAEWQAVNAKGKEFSWVRSSRQFCTHSGTGAKIVWLASAKQRPDYEALQAAASRNYFVT